ncbi:MAG: ATP-binding protein [Formivibrio sp.]|nr:ATP-binding protein [Formivibrio sp.]
MKLSLRTAIVLAILLGLLLPASISSYINTTNEFHRIDAEQNLAHQRYADLLVLGMQEPLWNLAPEAGKPLLESLMSDERVVRITVNDAALGVFLSANHPERRIGHVRSMTRVINKQGNAIGTVTLEMDDGLAAQHVAEVQQQYILSVVLQGGISLALIMFLLHTRILRPLRRLTEQSQQLARNKLQNPFVWHRNDEIGLLGQNLEATRNSLQTLLSTLEQKNVQLETDLRSRRQIELALRASKDRYRRLVETTHVIPWDANPTEWRFTYVGPQAEQLLGYPLTGWYSEGFLSSYLHPDDRHLAYELFTDFQREDNQFECRLLASDGREVWVLLIASTQIDEDNQRRLHGFLIDISERKLAELELEKYRSHLEETLESVTRTLSVSSHEMEAFNFAISHDLRTPLRAVDGFSQVLLEDYADVLDTNARHYLQRIRNAINSMSELIDNLLNLSSFSRIELRPQPVNLSAMVQDIAEQLNALQIDRHVSIDITPDLLVDADPKLIQIVLHNLLDNAWKYTNTAPEPHVTFGASNINHQPVYFVSDNGIGFDMSDANRLFSPFQRLHSQNEYSGSGVGLAIVQRIISRHKGHIWAKSVPNEGATFYFTLPTPKKLN